MSNIEKLYYNIHLLKDNYKDTEETKKARENVEKALGEKDYFKYEDEISALTSSIEKQGFITGFEYAVSLLTKMGTTTSQTSNTI